MSKNRNMSLDPVEISGKKYYSVKQFAYITNRSTATVYSLLGKGNSIRKLESIRVEEKPFIPVEEVTDFPFVSPGPNGKERPYFLNPDGSAAE